MGKTKAWGTVCFFHRHQSEDKTDFAADFAADAIDGRGDVTNINAAVSWDQLLQDRSMSPRAAHCNRGSWCVSLSANFWRSNRDEITCWSCKQHRDYSENGCRSHVFEVEQWCVLCSEVAICAQPQLISCPSHWLLLRPSSRGPMLLLLLRSHPRSNLPEQHQLWILSASSGFIWEWTEIVTLRHEETHLEQLANICSSRDLHWYQRQVAEAGASWAAHQSIGSCWLFLVSTRLFAISLAAVSTLLYKLMSDREDLCLKEIPKRLRKKEKPSK